MYLSWIISFPFFLFQANFSVQVYLVWSFAAPPVHEAVSCVLPAVFPKRTTFNKSASLAYVYEIWRAVSSGGIRLFFIASM